ncbi:MAG: Gfo/Idh/MocA family oxidoreductase [Geminicoccaceae bacterium]|nr:Gfo/Idh/MocA family oxidoreductase [Geminicoccaceae bacterium]
MTETFNFAVIGINHGHIDDQIKAMVDAGCHFTRFFAIEDELAVPFAERYPQAMRVKDERAILEDPSIRLVVSAAIPYDRTPIAVRAMRAGKDVMLDKPGCTTKEQLAELRAAQAETGQIVSICYSEHYQQKATQTAIGMVREGAIGRVIQTTGLGPHRIGNYARPDWFWDRRRNGSILTDIASHQFEQFLSITGCKDATILHSVETNFDNPEHPDFLDYGHAVVAAEGVTGFIRVDWFTPRGAPTWGDGRLFVVGTEGTIELRKYMDIEGRPGGDHLFLTDTKGTRYIDCSSTELTYGPRLRDDILNRTATAMPQDHCFFAMQLALEAHEKAVRIGGGRPA